MKYNIKGGAIMDKTEIVTPYEDEVPTQCNWCEWEGYLSWNTDICPNCKMKGYLMDLEEGAI